MMRIELADLLEHTATALRDDSKKGEADKVTEQAMASLARDVRRLAVALGAGLPRGTGPEPGSPEDVAQAARRGRYGDQPQPKKGGDSPAAGQKS